MFRIFTESRNVMTCSSVLFLFFSLIRNKLLD